jgi:hypothetical protein
MREVDQAHLNNAALAEPVMLSDCARKGCEYQRVAEEFGVALTSAVKERDEARAEAARWREEGEGLLRYACEASAAAYQRGAEAMREAAAREAVARPFVNDTPESIERAIRALPIPKDGP